MKKIMSLAFLALSILFSSSQVSYAELKNGQAAPDFKLTDINGTEHSLSSFAGKFVVLEWVNLDCPFVKKHYSGGNMQGLQKEYTGKGVIWLAINSSAKGKQGNFSAEDWKKKMSENGSAVTATLLDENGKVGKLYSAQTTPHMFIIDPKGSLIYQGAIDDKASTEAGDIPNSKNYVKAALDEALAGKPVSTASSKAYGCSVKY